MVSLSEVPLDSPVAAKSCTVQVGRGEASRTAGTARALELLLEDPAGRQWRRSLAVGAAAPWHQGPEHGSGPYADWSGGGSSHDRPRGSGGGPEREGWKQQPIGDGLGRAGAGLSAGPAGAGRSRPEWEGGDLAPPRRRGRQPRSPAAEAASGPRAGRSGVMRRGVRGRGRGAGPPGGPGGSGLAEEVARPRCPGTSRASRDARVSGATGARLGASGLSPAAVVAEQGCGCPRSPRGRGTSTRGRTGPGPPSGERERPRFGRKLGASGRMSQFQRRPA